MGAMPPLHRSALVLQCTTAEVSVTRAVTDVSAPEPQGQVVVDDCSVELELSSVPVFVQLDP